MIKMDNKSTIVIQGEKPIADYVLIYGATLVTSVNQCFNCDLYEITDDDSKPILKLPYGETDIIYNGKKISINYTHHPDPKGTYGSAVWKEEVCVSCTAENSKKVLTDFLTDARKFMQPGKINKVRTHILIDGCWNELSRKHKRPLDTIYLDNDVKGPLINDVKKFLATRDVYLKFGIPYKRNYMLLGPMGTGKTSLIFALASDIGYDLAIINFGPCVDDALLMRSLARLPENTILVLEDIDALFVERKANENSRVMVSFSGLLNALDGLGNKDKLITIMTTNYIDRLDQALIRPGRIDYIVNFTYATESQIRQIFQKLLPNQLENCEKFVRKVSNMQELTTAALQEFLFINRDCHNIIEKVDDLSQILNKRRKLLNPQLEKTSMYS